MSRERCANCKKWSTRVARGETVCYRCQIAARNEEIWQLFIIHGMKRKELAAMFNLSMPALYQVLRKFSDFRYNEKLQRSDCRPCGVRINSCFHSESCYLARKCSAAIFMPEIPGASVVEGLRR